MFSCFHVFMREMFTELCPEETEHCRSENMPTLPFTSYPSLNLLSQTDFKNVEKISCNDTSFCGCTIVYFCSSDVATWVEQYLGVFERTAQIFRGSIHELYEGV